MTGITNAMVEAAERLTRESSNSQQYLLLLGGLRALSGNDHEGSQVLDSYLLRALSLSGWVPELGSCHSCQSENPVAFSVHTGHVSCSDCSFPGAVKLGNVGLVHMRNLLAGNWAEVALSQAATKSNVSSVISAYLQWQLERGLRSMSMVERT